ncbi:basic salivary proline-rich protein 2-like [Corvus cornix cornix]|uniref:basic salivary proline-rich protein 2-like n=1 Tax=Corvus cornix cornix TaxID=932674 RepID=UPI001951F456|nr:basic salivary proline-rich protein 2-like [Corvus cornix cornix]
MPGVSVPLSPSHSYGGSGYRLSPHCAAGPGPLGRRRRAAAGPGTALRPGKPRGTPGVHRHAAPPSSSPSAAPSRSSQSEAVPGSSSQSRASPNHSPHAIGPPPPAPPTPPARGGLHEEGAGKSAHPHWSALRESRALIGRGGKGGGDWERRPLVVLATAAGPEPREPAPSTGRGTGKEPLESSPSTGRGTGKEPRESSPSTGRGTGKEPRESSPSTGRGTEIRAPSPSTGRGTEPWHPLTERRPRDGAEAQRSFTDHRQQDGAVALGTPHRTPAAGRDRSPWTPLRALVGRGIRRLGVRARARGAEGTSPAWSAGGPRDRPPPLPSSAPVSSQRKDALKSWIWGRQPLSSSSGFSLAPPLPLQNDPWHLIVLIKTPEISSQRIKHPDKT